MCQNNIDHSNVQMLFVLGLRGVVRGLLDTLYIFQYYFGKHQVFVFAMYQNLTNYIANLPKVGYSNLISDLLKMLYFIVGCTKNLKEN